MIRIKRRLLNLWLLDYTLPQLWEWIRLKVKSRKAPPIPSLSAHPPRDEARFFDRIVVISLPFRTDRREDVRRRMSRLQLPFTFFEAIHGRSARLSPSDERLFSPLAKRYLSPGSIGCALSHVRVWQQTVERGGVGCLVLEDDALLPDSFAEDLRRWLPEVPPDFDILFLGSGKTAPGDIRRFVSQHVFEPFYPREGMYAYVVSARGAKNLLTNLFPIHLANGGIDTAVGKLVRQRRLRAYHFLPVLCRADLASPSNVPNPGGKAKVLDEREETDG
ncbi:MAG: glycosyltransferase family 25 protein [Ferruginibacter sp.]|nr:glycosyltransferase family 25 protein [Cytophagales bacterium]